MSDVLQHLWPIITNVVASGVGVSILLALIARLVPNEKLYAFGFGLGQSLSRIAVLRFGMAWEKVEDFLVNSIGVVLSGTKAGLNSDDGIEQPAETADSKEA